MKEYDHRQIEPKWQAAWAAAKFDEAEFPSTRPKFYALIEFPYPSGDGLHVGHPRPYIGLDIVARKRRAEGFNVLYPIGWDAFGLPTENYAIKTGKNPRLVTEENTANFRRQIQALGISFDWSREINTTDPNYYKWTQWIFLQFYKKGLAYKKKLAINWCPKCLIGLANEEAAGGVCERCGTPVEQKEKEQWLLAITKYADRLERDLDEVDYLPQIKIQQRNWIGRSEGAEFEFKFSPNPDSASSPSPFSQGEGEPYGYMTADKKLWARLNEKSVEMRENPTPAEEKLWNELKNKATGYHFRRQHVIEKFIVDFVCLPKMLVVEVDGDVHDYQKEEDAERTQYLEAAGFKVIRFKNDEVLSDSDKVLSQIKQVLEALPLGEGVGGADSEFLTVFTTRPDTIFGVTFLARHGKADRFTGEYAINPASGEKVPIWEAEYVMADYGTGAVMGVPAHDERDLAFAQKHGLAVKPVIFQQKDTSCSYIMGVDEKDLKEIGVTIVERTKDGSLKTKIPFDQLEKFKALIRDKMKPHFWCEFTTEKGFHFIFKHKDGKIEEVDLDEKTNDLIDKYGATFNDEKPSEKAENVYSWLAENDFYKELLIHEGEGVLVNSGEFTGLESGEAAKKITERFGRPAVTYKLRDWIFSRQRYWGEPIPMIECQKCGWQPVPEEDLPVELPPVEKYQPTETGESPLAALADWVNTQCPKCGGPARRETDTMPNWAGSSWYYLAYVVKDKKSKTYNLKPLPRRQAGKTSLDYWLPVDWYNGGMEHTTLHLLYSRFWHKFLFDLGLVPTSEPYRKRTSHGLILAAGGQKMSKSRGNVINPDEIVARYGADTLRLYEMFMGPFDQAISWSEESLIGPRRFLEKVWRLAGKVEDSAVGRPDFARSASGNAKSGRRTAPSHSPFLHQTIQKVSADIEAMK